MESACTGAYVEERRHKKVTTSKWRISAYTFLHFTAVVVALWTAHGTKESPSSAIGRLELRQQIRAQWAAEEVNTNNARTQAERL